MPSGAVLSAACLLLRALRDPTVAARHRLLGFLLESPMLLSTLSGGAPEFMQTLSQRCGLTDPERGALIHTLVVALLPLAAGPEGVLDLLRDMQRAVLPDSIVATQQGQAEVDESASRTGLLHPVLKRLDPSSYGALLLRRVGVEMAAGQFEAVASAMHEAAAALEELRGWVVAGQPVGSTQVATTREGAGEARCRDAYVSAAAAGDLPAALAALHAQFDTAYGTALLGGSPVTGGTTPLGMVAGDAQCGRLLGTGPLARVQELLVSSASAPPVGGMALGRSLLHYALLAHATLYASVGAWEEAEDALAECTRVAQACGDAPAAAAALLLSGEVRQASVLAGQGGGASGVIAQAFEDDTAQELDVEAASMLRRARQRAGELGLWRQQASSSLQLVEGAVASACREAQEGGRALAPTGVAPITMPDWFSVDPFTSMRVGGYACGGAPASRSLTPGGAGGLSSGAGGGVPSATVTAVAAANREGLGAAVMTAITCPTVATAVSILRRQRAISERRPSLGGTVTTGFTAAEPGAAPPSGPGPAATWSVPLPLVWTEVLTLHRAAFASRARMWLAMGGSPSASPGPLPLVTAVLLADTATACGVAADASSFCGTGGHSPFDLDRLLDVIGCAPTVHRVGVGVAGTSTV